MMPIKTIEADVEVREFTGDARTASQFVKKCWAEAYSSKEYYPCWDEAYMEFNLFPGPIPKNIIKFAAYRGENLVGFLAAEKMKFTLFGREAFGTMSSWLSVPSGQEGKGVASALVDAMWSWQKENDCEFMIGFVDAGVMSGKGKAFWKRRIPNHKIFDKPLLSIKIVNAKNAINSGNKRIERMLLRGLSFVQRPKKISAERDHLRLYKNEDFSEVKTIFETVNDVDLGYVWEDQRLRHQLIGGSHAFTMISEHDGKAVAFVNGTLLNLMGRHPLRCVIIDFNGAVAGQEHKLPELFDAFFEMLRKDDLADAIMIFGSTVNRKALMRRAGFCPMPPFQKMIFLPVGVRPESLDFESMSIQFR